MTATEELHGKQFDINHYALLYKKLGHNKCNRGEYEAKPVH